MQRNKKSQLQCKLNLVTFFRNRSVKTQKKKRNQPHTRLKKANCDGMCSDKKLAPRSLGGDSSDRTTIERSLHSKINRRYLKMM